MQKMKEGRPFDHTCELQILCGAIKLFKMIAPWKAMNDHITHLTTDSVNIV